MATAHTMTTAEQLLQAPGLGRSELIRGALQGAPDLAVEVLSPNDRASEVTAKVHEWLSAGCGAVWVVDPDSHTVTSYRSRNEITVIAGNEIVDAGNILPGFRQPAADLFA